MKQARVNNVLKQMEAKGLSQIIVTEPSSVFYLTGKWIEPIERMLALLLRADGNHKFFLNTLFSVPEELGIEKIWFKDDDDGGEIVSKHTDKSKAVGVDKEWHAHFLLSLMKHKGASDYVNSSPIIDRIRMIKDAEEIALMKAASKINDAAMEKLVACLAEGRSEQEMEQKLSQFYMELGAQGTSFPPIISCGPNSYVSHAEITSYRPQPGDPCIFDVGCKKDYYCADMTRTPFYKSVSDKHRAIYEISLESTMAGEAAVKPGARFCDVDKAARDVIVKAGYGEYFQHRVGHSIGLNVHDFGNVSSANTDRLEPGMIFSVEPSISIHGEVGVRVEDLILVTETGRESLNSYRRDLQIVG